MRRRISTLMLSLGIASSGIGASAATLSILPDKLTYNVGETVTLTVVGDDQHLFTSLIFGVLRYDPALLAPNTQTQTQLDGPLQGLWITGDLESGPGFSEAFEQQIDITGPDVDSATNLPGVLSTVTLTAIAVGVANVDWDPATIRFFDIPFNGIPDGTSFRIVPEPLTASLLCLGLLALAGWRRVRT